MVAIRGAWTSGGIEWNFPDGHTLTTVSPIDYVSRMEADGSACVVIGDTERIQRMQWAITIRLRPGLKLVETEVTLNNRREVPGRYWFWATAAAPATEDIRFIYPMREAYPHAFWPIFTFPKYNSIDLGRYSQVPNALSLFARNSARDYFGVYYAKADWGIAHIADQREVPGKKTWTWGKDDAGKIWVNKLTDNDGQYVEFQAGRFETQMEHEFIAPHRVEQFTEYWFPLNQLGDGFDEVTPEVALRAQISQAQLRVKANSSARFNDAELTVEVSSQLLHRETIQLSPEKPFATSIMLPARDGLTVTIKTKEGRTLIHYRTVQPIDGNPNFVPATKPTPDPVVSASAEQVYTIGLAADKKSNDRAARIAYQRSLILDPGFSPAHIALGLSFYRSAEYSKAAEHLLAALRRNRDAGDAHYYLALVRRAQGQEAGAIEQLWWCVRAGHREPLARYLLGEIAIAANHFDEALAHLIQATRLDPRDLKARAVLAIALRLTGKLDEAQRLNNEVVHEMPIDYLARYEQYRILRERSREKTHETFFAEAQQKLEELNKLLGREPDSILELAFDYFHLGMWREARLVLALGVVGADSGGTLHSAHPLLRYALGYLQEVTGSPDSAASFYTEAQKAKPDYVFPQRPETIPILQAALNANPNDGRAAYYLGNLFAALNRDQEAFSFWQRAVQLDPGNLVARRNLARAWWFIKGKRVEAALEYENALAAAPEDYRLYVEFAQLLTELNGTELATLPRRIKLLENAPPGVRSRSAVVQALIAAYLDAGRFADAARRLDETTFTTGEGDASVHSLYQRAHLGLARQLRQTGKHLDSAREFLAATEYPHRFGAGRPAMRSQATEFVAAAREFELAGKPDEAGKWWQRAADDPLKSPAEPDENWSENYYYKAVALRQLGRHPEARALFERLANLIDDNYIAEHEAAPPPNGLRHWLAGLGLKALGKREAARAAFQQALQFAPYKTRAQAELRELRKK